MTGLPSPDSPSAGSKRRGGPGGSSGGTAGRGRGRCRAHCVLLPACLLTLLALLAHCVSVSTSNRAATISLGSAGVGTGQLGMQLVAHYVGGTASNSRRAGHATQRSPDLSDGRFSGASRDASGHDASGGGSGAVDGSAGNSSDDDAGGSDIGSSGGSLAVDEAQHLSDREGVPPDFDAEAYLAYHPHLKMHGITSTTAAIRHYMEFGRAEGRPARRLRVLVRYTACSGLFNQQYSHIAAFTLAIALRDAKLNTEVVLPPALCRSSFAHYYSTHKEKNEVLWSTAPLESLLDVKAIREYWRTRGLIVHPTPALEPFPDPIQPDVAFPLYPKENDPKVVVRLENIYLKNMEPSELVERALTTIVSNVSAWLQANPAAEAPDVALDLPCPLFSIRSLRVLPIVSEVAQSLRFAPALHKMAKRVVMGVTKGGELPFNGAHLRLETDARDWVRMMGGQQALWQQYINKTRALGFDQTTRMYAATGLLTYQASEEMSSAKDLLVNARVCSEVHHKEMYLSKTKLKALNSEQKALVDFLVLAKAARFVGLSSSTFSWYLSEYRTLQGLPCKTSGLVFVNAGTDPLFISAGTIV